jgi:hypothetical protein
MKKQQAIEESSQEVSDEEVSHEVCSSREIVSLQVTRRPPKKRAFFYLPTAFPL